jgi:hypothetical protein
MRTIVIVILACVASPALADVYRCHSGGKMIYQDFPCPDAKVIDNINGQAPPYQEQLKAVERATREQALATQFSKAREAESRSTTTTTTTTLTLESVGKSPAAPRPNGPDRYYDRPDRYKIRTVR